MAATAVQHIEQAEPERPVSLPKTHRQTVHATVKLDSQFWVSESKHGLVVFTRYWIAPAYIVEPLLDWWNLALEPGTYEATQRVRRLETPLFTEVDKLIPGEKVGTTVTPAKHGTMTLRLVRDGDPHALFKPGDVVVRTSFLDTIAPGWERSAIEFRAEAALKPMHLWDGDAFAGVVMPVRAT